MCFNESPVTSSASPSSLASYSNYLHFAESFASRYQHPSFHHHPYHKTTTFPSQAGYSQGPPTGPTNLGASSSLLEQSQSVSSLVNASSYGSASSLHNQSFIDDPSVTAARHHHLTSYSTFGVNGLNLPPPPSAWSTSGYSASAGNNLLQAAHYGSSTSPAASSAFSSFGLVPHHTANVTPFYPSSYGHHQQQQRFFGGPHHQGHYPQCDPSTLLLSSTSNNNFGSSLTPETTESNNLPLSLYSEDIANGKRKSIDGIGKSSKQQQQIKQEDHPEGSTRPTRGTAGNGIELTGDIEVTNSPANGDEDYFPTTIHAKERKDSKEYVKSELNPANFGNCSQAKGKGGSTSPSSSESHLASLLPPSGTTAVSFDLDSDNHLSQHQQQHPSSESSLTSNKCASALLFGSSTSPPLAASSMAKVLSYGHQLASPPSSLNQQHHPHQQQQQQAYGHFHHSNAFVGYNDTSLLSALQQQQHGANSSVGASANGSSSFDLATVAAATTRNYHHHPHMW